LPDKIENIINDTKAFLKYYKEYVNLPIYSGEINIESLREVLTNSDDISKIEEKSVNNIEVKKNTNVVVNDSAPLSFVNEKWMASDSIDELNRQIGNCNKCSLGKLRTNFVFGTGNQNAKVVLVGEAPGADEDREGKPFVGRAGKLLTDILTAIKFSRDEVFICNILKCRPPENRNPLPEEIVHCEPYLNKQLQIINPDLILALGSFAAQTLLKSNLPLGKLRGQFYDYYVSDKKIKLLATYHPAALLRNPNWKRPAWEDVQMFRKEYDNLLK
jgi:uracil-DNA glycosylase